MYPLAHTNLFQPSIVTLSCVVMKKRYMFGVEIPEEGPEDPSIEGELEHRAIEYSGVKWATATASGLCGFIAEDEDEFRACMQNMLPKMLYAREDWERETWAGLRRAAGLHVPPGSRY